MKFLLNSFNIKKVEFQNNFKLFIYSVSYSLSNTLVTFVLFLVKVSKNTTRKFVISMP